VDHLDNFLNILKTFLGCGEHFHETAVMENGWGEERKINGELATPIVVKGGEGGGAEPFANGWLFKLYFIHATSLCNGAPDIYVVRVVSIPTS
jgi:hypothetical protein